MKNILTTASIVLLILAVLITYLGLQRENLFNPPVITGLGFLMIAGVFLAFRRRM
jgi:hypothetical protein